MIRIECEASPLEVFIICVPKGGYAAKKRRPEVFLGGKKV